VTYEEVYLSTYDTEQDAKRSLGKYFDLYNHKRRHQGLTGMTPEMLYNQSAANKAV